MIPFFIPSPDDNDIGPQEGVGIGVAGIAILVTSAVFVVLFSWWWLFGVVIGLALAFKGICGYPPLTDEQKRAYGKHLPPHLRGQ